MSAVRGSVRRAKDLSDLSESALACQFYRRHAFPLPVYVPIWHEDYKALRADLRCGLCGTRKVIVISAKTYEQYALWYVYPDNYLVEGGRPDKVDAIREVRSRVSKAQIAEEKRLQKAADEQEAALREQRKRERAERAERVRKAAREANSAARSTRTPLRSVG